MMDQSRIDSNRKWSPRFSMLREKETARSRQFHSKRFKCAPEQVRYMRSSQRRPGPAS